MQINFKNYRFEIDVDKYSIESVLVFGSQVYGEADELSDTDFLMIVENCSTNRLNYLRETIASDLKIPENWIQVYTRRQFIEMCKASDLYIWSIKLQSVILYSRNNFAERCFNRLKIYTNIKTTMKMALQELDDIYRLNQKGHIRSCETIYEMGFIMREVFYNLCYLNKIIDFNKFECVKKCYQIEGVNIPFSYVEYERLIYIKRLYNKKQHEFYIADNPNKYINIWYFRIKKLIEEVLKEEEIKMNADLIKWMEDNIKK